MDPPLLMFSSRRAESKPFPRVNRTLQIYLGATVKKLQFRPTTFRIVLTVYLCRVHVALDMKDKLKCYNDLHLYLH